MLRTSSSRATMRRGPHVTFALVMSLLGAAIGACSGSKQGDSPTHPLPPPQVSQASGLAADAPPEALLQVGESAEQLFDAARASDWQAAVTRLEALRDSAHRLPLDLPKPDLVGQLQSRIDDLRQEVDGRQQVQTTDDANAVTHLAAELSAMYQTTIPYDILLLDYYGRQLELGIVTGSQTALAQTSADVRQTWNRIEPTIERRGHTDEARRFTDIVVQLEGAKTPSAFAAPTRAELDAVDRLETLFKPSKSR
jgi:hypothetical protein